MPTTIDIENMSVEEKILTMEKIWQNLSATANESLSPSWHGDILSKREKEIENGKESFLDWDATKKDIRRQIHEN